MNDFEKVDKYHAFIDLSDCYYEGDMPSTIMEVCSYGSYVHESDYDALLAAYKALQAKLDAFMLEHEPNAMSPEQIQRWSAHQKPL